MNPVVHIPHTRQAFDTGWDEGADGYRDCNPWRAYPDQIRRFGAITVFANARADYVDGFNAAVNQAWADEDNLDTDE